MKKYTIRMDQRLDIVDIKRNECIYEVPISDQDIDTYRQEWLVLSITGNVKNIYPYLKMNLNLYFTLYEKINSEWSLAPNIKIKNINTPEENRRKCGDFDQANNSYIKQQKHNLLSKIIFIILDFIKINNLYSLKNSAKR